MDPVSALLAGYLTTVQSFGQSIGEEIFSHSDLEGTTETVEIQGFRVNFWHQTWKIRDSSVCQNYSVDVVKHSKCTHAAKELFIQTCDRLRAKRLSHPSYLSLKKMYCTAATNYQPMQAGIEWSNTQATADAEAIQKCRLAQAALLGENTPDTRKIKQEACAKVLPEHGPKEK